MYKKFETFVKIDGGPSKEFEEKVGVHQVLIICALLFAMMMDEVAKDVRDSGLK